MTRVLTGVLALLSAPAFAVGMAPLSKAGITDGSGKAFYLTVINPYPGAERFIAHSYLANTDEPAAKAVVFPSDMVIGSGGRRQILVVIKGLEPGETYDVRVCAERPRNQQEIVHVRVCSKLSARRLPGHGGQRRHRPGRLLAATA